MKQFFCFTSSSTFETVSQLRAKFSTCSKSCLLILRILLSQISSSNNFKIKKKKKGGSYLNEGYLQLKGCNKFKKWNIRV